MLKQRRGRVHRVDDGGCGGKVRVIYIRGQNPIGTMTLQSCGEVCTRCRQVWLDPVLTIA